MTKLLKISVWWMIFVNFFKKNFVVSDLVPKLAAVQEPE